MTGLYTILYIITFKCRVSDTKCVEFRSLVLLIPARDNEILLRIDIAYMEQNSTSILRSRILVSNKLYVHINKKNITSLMNRPKMSCSIIYNLGG